MGTKQDEMEDEQWTAVLEEFSQQEAGITVLVKP